MMLKGKSSSEKSEFRKSLNLFDSTAIVIGSMIGSGIFIVSADMARTIGSPGWLMVGWLISGLMTLIAAVSYGELASMFPKAGGIYVYLREAFNPLSGFLYGWTLFMVIQTGSIAAVAMAFGKFMGVIIPWVSEENVWLNLGFIKFHTVHIVAISSIVFLTWMNTRGIRTGKYMQNSFTYTKLLVLALFILLGLFVAKNTGAIVENKKIFWDAMQINGGGRISLTGFALLAALATSMVGSLFTYDAWYNLTFTSGEVINPKRNVPLGMALGTLIVTFVYLLTNLVYIYALPLRGSPEGISAIEQGIQYASNDRVGTAAISGIFGDYSSVIMAAFIVFSTFGCNNGLILTGARVYYAMAIDGLFFSKVGTLNKKGVPAIALIIQGVWASLLCLSGTYSNLLDYVIFAVLIFFVLTIAGIFVLRVKRPDIERPYKAFGYPYIPALYILAASFILVILLIYKPEYTWPGLIIVLLGVPVYYLWKRKK
ncbi:MAG: amino acid transporter [Bacteroidetes bacterium GWC2_33_15]|nr:MAG: amino acid transporter [Bacteroidetes bacterium GWA2_33_15]OFX51478.1 MAG: amino acid transporter [Bacteroidetes bacterium GWC2_33_15]OFX65775.1 MAG: amino acid transporter [Bacteroidetes bacterium GWB2_32_14]OFX69506.1 MAG: amino acid transporter [Bacteroidetes bacterium GWD2_33_33]HAN17765.1 amino acid transporter [Bacteroidales bacterium]